MNLEKNSEQIKNIKKLKIYEKLGAVNFQKIVFAVEKLKFKIIKTFLPNYINFFDKQINKKTKKEIKKIKKEAEKRDKIEKNHPMFLKSYDKYISFKERFNNKFTDKLTSIRNKIKAFNPKVIEFYDKYYKKVDLLKGLNNEQKVKKLKELSKIAKMYIREEMNYNKNKNYHLNKKRPTEIIFFLEWNKRVHVQSLTKNTLAIPILVILMIFGISYITPILILELLNAIINFECINIQNYNITRYEIKEKALKKIEERTANNYNKNYNEASKLIFENVYHNDELISINEIIEKATSIEQIQQLKNLLNEQLKSLTNEQSEFRQMKNNDNKKRYYKI